VVEVCLFLKHSPPAQVEPVSKTLWSIACTHTPLCQHVVELMNCIHCILLTIPLPQPFVPMLQPQDPMLRKRSPTVILTRFKSVGLHVVWSNEVGVKSTCPLSDGPSPRRWLTMCENATQKPNVRRTGSWFSHLHEIRLGGTAAHGEQPEKPVYYAIFMVHLPAYLPVWHHHASTTSNQHHGLDQFDIVEIPMNSACMTMYSSKSDLTFIHLVCPPSAMWDGQGPTWVRLPPHVIFAAKTFLQQTGWERRQKDGNRKVNMHTFKQLTSRCRVLTVKSL